MKVGDLVKCAHPDSFTDCGDQVGVVVEVNKWVDGCAAHRNFGFPVKVLWANGQIEAFDEHEIDIIRVVS